MGDHWLLHLQLWFNDVLGTTPGVNQLRRWYKRRLIHLHPGILFDLETLLKAISDDPLDPVWERPIGLIIPRMPTIVFCTDASLKAMGGWCWANQLNHMWRLTLADFHACGLPNKPGKWTNPQDYGCDVYPDNPHINILEFIALIVEIWICARQIHTAVTTPNHPDTFALPPPGGHRIAALADNTSALSWLRYATRTRRVPVRQLARLLTAFLSLPFPTSHFRIDGKHLAGIKNKGADHLSQFEKSPSWASAMANCAPLRTLRVCLLPRELLSVIASSVSQKRTGDWFKTAATKLWTLEPPGFVTGLNCPQDSSTSLQSNASQQTKR
jgi:hypothetical protein